MGNYFNELRWKIIRANNLLQFIILALNYHLQIEHVRSVVLDALSRFAIILPRGY